MAATYVPIAIQIGSFLIAEMGFQVVLPP